MTSTLYAYRVHAYERGAPKTAHPLDDIFNDGTGRRLLEDLDKIIRKGVEWPPKPDGVDDRERKHTVQERHIPPGDANVRYGLIRVEKPAVAMDIETSRHGPVEVDQGDPSRRSLFFWFGAPSNSSSGLLLTERAGSFSIVTAFWEQHVVATINAQYGDNVTVRIEPFVPMKAWELYQQHGEQVTGLELIHVIKEKNETKEGKTTSRKVGEVRQIVKMPLGLRRPEVTRILRRRKASAARNEAVEVLGGEYVTGDLEWDTVIIDLQISGKSRRARIGKDTMAQLGYPADGVAVDARGIPLLDPLQEHAAELARSIGGAIGF